jgi:hypothetical protein
MTQERAQEIWDARKCVPGYGLQATPEEDAYVKRVWDALPGDTSWMTAFYLVLNGKAEEQLRKAGVM